MLKVINSDLFLLLTVVSLTQRYTLAPGLGSRSTNGNAHDPGREWCSLD